MCMTITILSQDFDYKIPAEIQQISRSNLSVWLKSDQTIM